MKRKKEIGLIVTFLIVFSVLLLFNNPSSNNNLLTGAAVGVPGINETNSTENNFTESVVNETEIIDFVLTLPVDEINNSIVNESDELIEIIVDENLTNMTGLDNATQVENVTNNSIVENNNPPEEFLIALPVTEEKEIEEVIEEEIVEHINDSEEIIDETVGEVVDEIIETTIEPINETEEVVNESNQTEELLIMLPVTEENETEDVIETIIEPINDTEEVVNETHGTNINLTENDTFVNETMIGMMEEIIALADSSLLLDWIYPTTDINVSQHEFFNVTVNVTCSGGNCGEVNVSLDPASGTIYNFTSCGITGKTGPSQDDCDTSYTGTTLAGSVTLGTGIQNWTVPSTGTYTIEAVGAKGGGAGGGNGTRMVGDFELTEGEVIKIMVGQRGTLGSGSGGSSNSGGGGGGTFVVDSNNSIHIIAAGGGGGNADYDGGSFPDNPNGDPGNTESSGSSTYQGGGGINGGGGDDGQTNGQGSGGGGYSGDGQDGSSTTGGDSFLNGGVGGTSSCTYFGGNGGFGGGGAGCSNVLVRGGGGGGYSGGQGATYSYAAATIYPSTSAIDLGYGGGGGSANNGTNQNNTASFNTEDGYVTITYTATAKSGLITNDTSADHFYTNGTNPYNVSLNSGESEIITWWVNATGEASSVHEFFVYANQTNDSSVANETTHFNITIIDNVDPIVSILYPTATVYDLNITELNYTYTDLDSSGSCWYSVDSGLTNSTNSIAGTNFTGLSSSDGNNTWTVYCNDTSGNFGSDIVTFNSSIPSVGLTLITPSAAAISEGVNVTANKTFTVSTSVSCTNNDCGEVNVTLNTSNSSAYNFTITSNPSNVTLNKGGSGTITWTINATGDTNNTDEFFVYANRTSDMSISDETTHWNVTIVNYSVGISDPSVSLTYPVSSTNYVTDVSELNYTVSIDPLTQILDKCWYSTDNGATNSSNVSAGVNFSSLTSVTGSNTWTVYCNDNNSLVGSSFVTFSKVPMLGLTMLYPTENVNVTLHETFNVLANVSCSNVNCGEINVSLDPASETVYNFTTCGATGRVGPSQDNCDTDYSGTTLDGLVNVTSGIQNWTVPTTGTYTIETAGAQGGNGSTTTYLGGNGSRMYGEFELTTGDILFILTGQMGSTSSSKAGGGGGGTFVVIVNDSSSSVMNDGTKISPLIIAGGGSGGGGNSNPGNGQPGLNETSGGTGSQGVYAGGTDGSGGAAGSGSGGGGGFSGNGTDAYGSTFGIAFLSGGTGGDDGCDNGGIGGFGGGAGGEWCSQGATGPGGGYSGGGGTNSNGIAGGGGSYNGGTNQNNTAGINVADGYVSITFTGAVKSGIISMNTSATPFYTTINNPYNVSLNAGESTSITWTVNATGDVDSTHEFFTFANWTSDMDVSNVTSIWNVTIVDFSVSPITIDYPTSGNYVVNVSEFNYTVDAGSNLDQCWYSVDNGATNSSQVSPGVNFSSVISAVGSNTWIVYCNDTFGLYYSKSVTFSKVPLIGLTVIRPTGNVNVTLHETFSVLANVSCSNVDCGEINVSLDPVSETVYNFTTCGASGKTGPSQDNCDTNYTGTTLEGLVNINDGIQNFTVPTTGTYIIEVYGARGGNSVNYIAPTYAGGGLGAKMVGKFSLTAGDQLQILVGQEGSDSTTTSRGGGGGGGTYVTTGESYTTATPLIIAGGGGGTGQYAIVADVHGQNGTDGGDGMYTTTASGGGAGGTEGAGGTRVDYGGGGAGWDSNGQTSYSSATIPYTFHSGGVGGALYSGGADGGFGGGGGCYAGSGGGGGYSGGGGGKWSSDSAGGGGGSFNNGTDQNNTAGINTAEGYVSITLTGSAKNGVISTNTLATPFYTTTNNPYNVSLNVGESTSITWTVNATGSQDTEHEFFVFANWTSDMDVSNTTSIWNVTIVNFSVSPISIVYPISGTEYLTNVTQLNYTLESGYDFDQCWYSTNGGATNSTLVSPGINFSSVSNSGGSNTWTVYCNDTLGLDYTRSVTFSRIPFIGLTMVSPLTDVNVTQNETFTISTTVSCNNVDCGEVNVSLDPASDAETIQHDSFESNFTSPWYDDGVAYAWSRNSGGTSSSSTGPSSAFSGTYYIYVETSSGSCYTNGQTAIVYQTPAINFDSYSNEEISWYNNMYGSNIGVLELQENTTGSWVNLWTESGNQGTAWFQNTTDLSSLSGSGNLRFYYTCAGGYTGDIAIDEINISGAISTSTKSGLISMNTSATPFYTTTQNPYNLSLNEGESETITWTVNATGNINTTHEFFAYANWTSDQTISNETDHWNISILENGSYTGVDVTGPIITFDLSNNYYSNDTGLDINYSTSELNLSSCWYSNDSMSENISLGNDGNCSNITSIVWTESQHNLTIWANDSLDNNGSSSLTFTIDFTNPNGTLISPENNTYNTTNASQNFTINLTDNIGVNNVTLYIYNSSGSLISNITTVLLEYVLSSTIGTVVDLADGIYTWFYELFDWAGNSFTTGNYTVTVDASNPSLTIVSPANNTYTTNSNLDINYTVTDFNLSSCWYSNDTMDSNTTLADCTTNITGITWSQGEHNLTIWVNDSGGYQNTSTITFTLDLINPNATLISPENNTYNTPASQNFTVNLSDNIGIKNATLHIYNSSSELVNQTTNADFLEHILTSNIGIVVTLADDNYTWYYDVFDWAGNYYVPVNNTLVIDATNPLISVTSFTNDTYTNNTGLNINYTVSDTYLDSCWYSNDSYLSNTTLSPCQTNITSVIWSEGQHNLTIWVNDSAGNVNNSVMRFTIDTINPTISIDSPSNESTSTDSGLNVTYSAADINLASCWYSNDSYLSNTTLASCVNITSVTWSEGQHNVTIWNNDSAGHLNNSAVTFSIDSINPIINIDTPSNNTYTNNTGLNINYTVTDTNLESCWYSNDSMLSNISFSTCGDNITSLTWSEGQHNLIIWANDSYGNLGTSTLTFTIDLVSPVLEYLSPTFNNATTTSNTSVEINVSITEANLDEVKYNWNGTNYTLYNDSLVLMMNFDNVSDLEEDDTHVFDVSGNGNNGTLFSGTTLNMTGKYNGGLNIDGSSGNVTISNEENFDFERTDPFSSCFWVNFDTIGDTVHTPLSKLLNSGTYAGWEVHTWDSTSGTYAGDAISLYIVENWGTSKCIFASAENVLNGTVDIWQHICITYDGSSAVSGVNIYQDGVSQTVVDSAAHCTSPPSGTVLNDIPLLIGEREGSGNTLDGMMDEIKIWNRSLSEQEIYQQYISNLNKFNSTQWYLYVNQSKNATDGLNDSAYTYQTFVTDNANAQAQTEERTITISQAIGPTLTINSPTTNSFTTSTELDVTYTATSATLGSCWYSDNGGSNTTLTDCANITSVTWSEGEHNVTIYTNDTNGESTSTVTFTVDTITPTISISTPSDNTYTTNTGLNVNYSAVDTNLDSCWYSNDSFLSNTTLASCDTNITSITWQEGQHNITVWTNDSAGNVNNDSVTFTVDTINPTLSFISPNNNDFSNNTGLDVNYNATDTNLASCWYSNDSYLSNTTLASCTNITSVTWSEGQHNVTIWTNDSARNSNSANVTFTIDSLDPVISFVSPTFSSGSIKNNTSVEINVSITESYLNELIYNWNGTNYSVFNDSLVLMMNFDNLSAVGDNSSYTIDISGHNNNGTLVNAVYNTSGKYGSAIYMDGSGDYVDLADSGSLNITSPITISLWEKTSSSLDITQTWGMMLVGRGTYGDPRNTMDLRIGPTGEVAVFGYEYGSGSNSNYATGSTNIADGNWHHVVGQWNGSDCLVYVDGIMENSVSCANTPGAFDEEFIIGKDIGDAFGQDEFNGLIDEVRIWNKSLSQQEIYQQYVSNLNKFNSTQWYFYVNQSQNATENLSYDTYTYQTFAEDDSNNLDNTEQRTVIITNVTGPTLTINSPTTNSFTTNTGLDITYTVISSTLDSCWYSTDSGITNNTLTDCANITSVTWEEGEHNVTIYSNDTFGESTSTVTFTVDTISPTITIEYPTDDYYTTNTGLNVNYSAVDTNLDSCWYSNDSFLSNTTLASCANITSVTWSEGQHNVTLWINDSAGNSNSDSVSFIVDTINPSLTISSPSNNTFSADTGLNLNYTATDTNLESCWYANDSMTSNTTLASCANITTITWSEQQHEVYLWVNDSAGNKNQTDVTFTIDTSSLIISISTPSSNYFSTDSGLDVNYTISGDNIEDCWYSNDSFLSNTTLADCDTNITSITWSEGQHNVTIYANDSVGEVSSASITFYVDLTDPTVNLIVPTDNLIDNTIGVPNLFFNCTVADNINLANISLYITNSTNQSFALNQTSSLSGASGEKTWNLSLSNGNYTWNCLVSDLAGRNNWSLSNYSLLVNATPDTDIDGLPDFSDPLLYNESNVTNSGLTRLNISVGGNRTNGTFSGKEDIFFYDDTELMVNFSHNFSITNLDLSNVSIIKDTNYLIINLSSQLQSDYNKTIYLENNEFVSLCVKDEEISSIDEISSDCTGSNETDLTSCLTANISVGFDNGTNTTNSVGCAYDGATFSVSNLQYSGIKGTVAESSSSSSSSSGGGSSGGSGGGGGAVRIIEPESIDEEDYECYTHDDCNNDKACFYHQCVKLFDIKILDIDSPIGSDGYMGFTYFIKGMANFSNDVVIDFWLEKDDNEISSGRDTIYLGNFEEKTESTKIFIPKNLSNGNYNFYIQVGYEDYLATAKRTVYVEVTEEGINANLVGQAIGDKVSKIIFDLSWLWIILVIMLLSLLIGFGWKHKRKLKYQIILTDRRKTKRSLNSKQREKMRGLKYKEFAKNMIKLLKSKKYKQVVFESENTFINEEKRKWNFNRKISKFLHDYFGMFKTDKEKENLIIIQEQSLAIKKIEKDKRLKQSLKRRLELKKKWHKFLHDHFGMFKTDKEKENLIIIQEQSLAIKKIEKDKRLKQSLKRRLELKKKWHKFLHDHFGMFKTDKEKKDIEQAKEQEINKRINEKKKNKEKILIEKINVQAKRSREKRARIADKEKRAKEARRNRRKFFHDYFGMFKTAQERESIQRAKANRIAQERNEKKKKKEDRLKKRRNAQAKKLREKRARIADKEKRAKEASRKRRKFLHDNFGMFKTDKEKEAIQRAKENKIARKRAEKKKKKEDRLKKNRNAQAKKLREKRARIAKKKKIAEAIQRRKQEVRRHRRKFFHDHFGMFKTDKEKEAIQRAKENKIARKRAERRRKKAERLRIKRAARAKKLKEKRDLLAEKRRLIEVVQQRKRESRRKRRKFFHDNFGVFKTNKEKEAIQRAKENKIARKRREKELKKKYREEKRIRKQEEKIQKIIVKEKIKLFEKRKKEEEKVKDQVDEMKTVLAEKKFALNEEERRTHEKLAEIKRQQRKKQKKEERKLHLLNEKKAIIREAEREKERTIKKKLKLFEKKVKH